MSSLSSSQVFRFRFFYLVGKNWFRSQSTYIYRVQSSAWRLPNYWPPTPSPPSECVLPPHQRRGGGNTRRAVRGGGSILRKTPDIGLASYSIIPLRGPVSKTIKIQYLLLGTARRTWPALSRWWTSVQLMIRIRKWTWPACSPRRAAYRYHGSSLCFMGFYCILFIFTQNYQKEQEQYNDEFELPSSPLERCKI